MQFSLSYFSSLDDETSRERYRLVLEGARFADEHGFTAVWTPERHFQPFGGLFPNPSVLSAALATMTTRVQLRAGSVVLTNQHPARVAEEWSVVDNLSGGRVGISFASGWHPNDFVFFPECYAERKAELYRRIRTFRALWRGEQIALRNGAGNEREIRIYPKPVQADVPIWLTVAKDPAAFVQAGQNGLNVLTYLLKQSREELARNIAAYRQARAAHGHDPATGHVTVLVHTFLGEDLEAVKETTRAPFTNYLKSFMNLLDTFARNNGKDKDLTKIPQKWIDQTLNQAFERYFKSAALIGTPESCGRTVQALEAIGVTELACLIDFGVDQEQVLHSLPYLNQLRLRHA